MTTNPFKTGLQRAHLLWTSLVSIQKRYGLSVIRWLYHVALLGFINLYRFHYGYRGPGNHPSTDLDREDWKKVEKTWLNNWGKILRIDAVLFPITFALLPISHVTGTPSAFTTAIMAAVSSAVSSVSILLYPREQTLEEEDVLMRRWIKASQQPNLISSVDFWSSIALPVYSFLWSIFHFVTTIGILMWSYHCPPDICSSNRSPTNLAILPTLLFVISGFFMFRLCKLLQYI